MAMDVPSKCSDFSHDSYVEDSDVGDSDED